MLALFIGGGDESARLEGVHEIDLGTGQTRDLLDFGRGRHVEGTDAAVMKGMYNLERIIGFEGIEQFAREILCQPLGGMGGGEWS